MKIFKKYVLYLIAFSLVFSFSSCDLFPGEDVTIPPQGEDEEDEGPYIGPQPKYSKMILDFADNTYSSENNQYEYTINVDETNISSGYFIFTASHVFDEGISVKDPGFEFVCEDASIINSTKTTCMVDYISLSQLGTYTIRAKSKVDSTFDRYFVINVTSNLKGITVSYKIQSAYLKPGLEYTDEMKEGTITSLTKDLTLCAGAVYDFTVNDKSGSNYSVKNVVTQSSSSYVFFRNIEENRGEMACMQLDNKESTVTFRAGKTDIKNTVKITLRDISTSLIEEITPESGKTDQTLCFTANTLLEPDKHYDYQVKVNQAGNDMTDLMFCIDYYDWNIATENGYLDNEYYTVDKNLSPSWYTRSSVSYVQEGSVRYKVDFDGVLNRFSITPIEDTVFNSTKHGQKNLHSYVYARYKTDPSDTYRWRWRIMVGGELESLQMSIHDSEEDTILEDNLLEIHPGDETSWIFRARYIPDTTSNRNTLWYISDSNQTKTYTLGGGAVTTLPIPASYGSAANRTLYMFDGKEEQKDFGDLRVYYYYLDTLTEDGISDLWTNYGTNGLDCKLVAVNLDTGLFSTIDIKNYTQETLVVKGISSSSTQAKVNLPAVINTLKATDKSEVVEIKTGYVDGNTSLQSYPTTDVGDGYRTFFMPVDSRLAITLESTFDMESVTAEGNMYAKDSFTGANVYIDEGKRAATLVFTTIYNMSNEENKTEALKRQSLTDNAVFSVKVNDYEIYVKIVVYDSDNKKE